MAGWSLWWKMLEGTVRHRLFWLMCTHTVPLFSSIKLNNALIRLIAVVIQFPEIFFVLPSFFFTMILRHFDLCFMYCIYMALVYAMVDQLYINTLSLWSVFFRHRYLLLLSKRDEHWYWFFSFFFFFSFFTFSLRMIDRKWSVESSR